jgi:hypothetical protein
MFRWLRLVVSSEHLAVVLVLYGATEAIWRAVEAWFGAWGLINPSPSVSVLYLAAFVYGPYRVGAFHPGLRPGYRAWLTTTPWTSRKPLPLGPVHLVLQDVVLLALGTVLTGWEMPQKAAILPLIFLAGYLTVLGLSLARTETALWAWAVWFGLGLVVRLLPNLLAALAAAGVTYVVAYVGLRRSLTHFPWDQPLSESGRTPLIESAAAGNPLGWPFARLGPRFLNEPSISRRSAFLTSLLVGWWSYAVAALPWDPAEREGGLVVVVLIAAVSLPGIRLLIYINGYEAPISLLGRLATGRWFIPGYDQVFVAPLLAVWIGLELTVVVEFAGLDTLVGMPLVLALILLIVLSVGPSLKTWRLTGHHRIVPANLRAGAVQGK